MNSIVFTHFAAPKGAPSLEIALDRLSAWIDSELDSLEALLALADPGAAATDIAALRGLHLDASSTCQEVGQLLAEAQVALERLLERMRAMPVDVPLVGPAPHDADAWLRWSGARLEDILATLCRALAV
jgi:hypothetical protein